MLLAAVFCLCMTACIKMSEPGRGARESQTEATDIGGTGQMQQSIREDIPATGMFPQVYVDRQGTDTVYSSISITQSDNSYEIEMEIYRLGYFQGTAAETQGMLVYTDASMDINGVL